MLDEHDGRAHLIVDVEYETAHVLLFLEIHPGHRLIEQQQLRLRSKSSREFHALLQAVREPAHRGLADVLDLEKIDDRLDFGAVLELLALRRPPIDRLLQEIGFHLQVAPGHDVVEDRHAAKEGDVLEGPRDALLRGLVRIHIAAPSALEGNRPLLRVVDAVDDVEHRRFAGAVRADDRADLVLPDVEGNALERNHPAEGKRDAVDLEDRPPDFPACRHVRRKGNQAAFLAAAAPKVFASTICRSADTVPLRPSSKRICVST